MRKDLEKRVKRKLSEMAEIDTQITKLTVRKESLLAVVSELQAIIRLLPRESKGQESDRQLREGTDVSLAFQALRKNQRPMHIRELLRAMGMDPTPQRRSSVSSQISAYVKKRELFVRTGPNTFGLFEYGTRPIDAEEVKLFGSSISSEDDEDLEGVDASDFPF